MDIWIQEKIGVALLFDARFLVSRLAMPVTYCNDNRPFLAFDISDKIREDRAVDATVIS